MPNIFSRIGGAIFKPSTRGKTRWAIVFIILMVIIVGSYDQPAYWNKSAEAINGKLHQVSWLKGVSIPEFHSKPFKLGLDLQGGVQ
ncbi:hypothetical protein HY224_02380, partial [Candidatus Uhrbacteria bacterium]|nr:hypothetical protein [Candidatus Uhrbacteria bacterium]